LITIILERKREREREREREGEREREFYKVQLMRRGGRIVEHSSNNEASFAFKEERAIKSLLSNLELYILE
jgi:hypothetical protein